MVRFAKYHMGILPVIGADVYRIINLLKIVNNLKYFLPSPDSCGFFTRACKDYKHFA